MILKELNSLGKIAFTNTFWENHGNKSRTHPTEAGQCRDLKHIKKENN